MEKSSGTLSGPAQDDYTVSASFASTVREMRKTAKGTQEEEGLEGEKSVETKNDSQEQKAKTDTVGAEGEKDRTDDASGHSEFANANVTEEDLDAFRDFLKRHGLSLSGKETDDLDPGRLRGFYEMNWRERLDLCSDLFREENPSILGLIHVAQRGVEEVVEDAEDADACRAFLEWHGLTDLASRVDTLPSYYFRGFDCTFWGEKECFAFCHAVFLNANHGEDSEDTLSALADAQKGRENEKAQLPLVLMDGFSNAEELHHYHVCSFYTDFAFKVVISLSDTHGWKDSDEIHTNASRAKEEWERRDASRGGEVRTNRGRLGAASIGWEGKRIALEASEDERLMRDVLQRHRLAALVACLNVNRNSVKLRQELVEFRTCAQIRGDTFCFDRCRKIFLNALGDLEELKKLKEARRRATRGIYLNLPHAVQVIIPLVLRSPDAHVSSLDYDELFRLLLQTSTSLDLILQMKDMIRRGARRFWSSDLKEDQYDPFESFFQHRQGYGDACREMVMFIVDRADSPPFLALNGPSWSALDCLHPLPFPVGWRIAFVPGRCLSEFGFQSDKHAVQIVPIRPTEFLRQNRFQNLLFPALTEEHDDPRSASMESGEGKESGEGRRMGGGFSVGPLSVERSADLLNAYRREATAVLREISEASQNGKRGDRGSQKSEDGTVGGNRKGSLDVEDMMKVVRKGEVLLGTRFSDGADAVTGETRQKLQTALKRLGQTGKTEESGRNLSQTSQVAQSASQSVCFSSPQHCANQVLSKNTRVMQEVGQRLSSAFDAFTCVSPAFKFLRAQNFTESRRATVRFQNIWSGNLPIFSSNWRSQILSQVATGKLRMSRRQLRLLWMSQLCLEQRDVEGVHGETAAADLWIDALLKNSSVTGLEVVEEIGYWGEVGEGKGKWKESLRDATMNGDMAFVYLTMMLLDDSREGRSGESDNWKQHASAFGLTLFARVFPWHVAARKNVTVLSGFPITSPHGTNELRWDNDQFILRLLWEEGKPRICLVNSQHAPSHGFPPVNLPSLLEQRRIFPLCDVRQKWNMWDDSCAVFQFWVGEGPVAKRDPGVSEDEWMDMVLEKAREWVGTVQKWEAVDEWNRLLFYGLHSHHQRSSKSPREDAGKFSYVSSKKKAQAGGERKKNNAGKMGGPQGGVSAFERFVGDWFLQISEEGGEILIGNLMIGRRQFGPSFASPSAVLMISDRECIAGLTAGVTEEMKWPVGYQIPFLLPGEPSDPSESLFEAAFWRDVELRSLESKASTSDCAAALLALYGEADREILLTELDGAVQWCDKVYWRSPGDSGGDLMKQKMFKFLQDSVHPLLVEPSEFVLSQARRVVREWEEKGADGLLRSLRLPPPLPSSLRPEEELSAVACVEPAGRGKKGKQAVNGDRTISCPAVPTGDISAREKGCTGEWVAGRVQPAKIGLEGKVEELGEREGKTAGTSATSDPYPLSQRDSKKSGEMREEEREECLEDVWIQQVREAEKEGRRKGGGEEGSCGGGKKEMRPCGEELRREPAEEDAATQEMKKKKSKKAIKRERKEERERQETRQKEWEREKRSSDLIKLMDQEQLCDSLAVKRTFHRSFWHFEETEKQKEKGGERRRGTVRGRTLSPSSADRRYASIGHPCHSTNPDNRPCSPSKDDHCASRTGSSPVEKKDPPRSASQKKHVTNSGAAAVCPCPPTPYDIEENSLSRPHPTPTNLTDPHASVPESESGLLISAPLHRAVDTLPPHINSSKRQSNDNGSSPPARLSASVSSSSSSKPLPPLRSETFASPSPEAPHQSDFPNLPREPHLGGQGGAGTEEEKEARVSGLFKQDSSASLSQTASRITLRGVAAGDREMDQQVDPVTRSPFGSFRQEEGRQREGVGGPTRLGWRPKSVSSQVVTPPPHTNASVMKSESPRESLSALPSFSPTDTKTKADPLPLEEARTQFLSTATETQIPVEGAGSSLILQSSAGSSEGDRGGGNEGGGLGSETPPRGAALLHRSEGEAPMEEDGTAGMGGSSLSVGGAGQLRDIPPDTSRGRCVDDRNRPEGVEIGGNAETERLHVILHQGTERQGRETEGRQRVFKHDDAECRANVVSRLLGPSEVRLVEEGGSSAEEVGRFLERKTDTERKGGGGNGREMDGISVPAPNDAPLCHATDLSVGEKDRNSSEVRRTTGGGRELSEGGDGRGQGAVSRGERAKKVVEVSSSVRVKGGVGEGEGAMTGEDRHGTKGHHRSRKEKAKQAKESREMERRAAARTAIYRVAVQASLFSEAKRGFGLLQSLGFLEAARVREAGSEISENLMGRPVEGVQVRLRTGPGGVEIPIPPFCLYSRVGVQLGGE
uniref:Uncharacterized protein n=1 Tax=Chromera velia CCMP2878 TaxID=1169474 RepID=A0A0G4HAG6_9ALVE|eukprot:Cvel_25503.t1-p1 / transcript=Cvel_25503.t1 / gene=Cvel_25503 / organism=Chromera_velia_CCMP2878 / gene_product=hypothetical protein / transcript_product=hypothetical protein / location=Cvel_scaffold2900:7806-18669(-) / protein_length=2320 / sequence_SO=supercontig / SO=protein_coding / is_pseudo=false